MFGCSGGVMCGWFVVLVKISGMGCGVVGCVCFVVCCG